MNRPLPTKTAPIPIRNHQRNHLKNRRKTVQVAAKVKSLAEDLVVVVATEQAQEHILEGHRG